jgi:hypothetical protein
MNMHVFIDWVELVTRPGEAWSGYIAAELKKAGCPLGSDPYSRLPIDWFNERLRSKGIKISIPRDGKRICYEWRSE